MIPTRGQYDISAALGVGTNIDITGLPFGPDLLFVQMSRAAPNGMVNGAVNSEGMAITGPLQSCLVASDDDGNANDQCNSALYSDRVAIFLSPTGTDQGSLEFMQFLPTGFRLRVKTQFLAQRTIQWVAVACQGAVLEMGDITCPAAPGNVVTVTTTEPQALIVFGSMNMGPANGLRVCIGLSAGPTQQCVVAATSRQGAATGSADYYGNNLDVFAYGQAGAMNGRAQVQAFGALSFTLNWISTPGASVHGRYLVIGGGGSDAYGGEFLSVMDVVTHRTLSGMPFRPALMMLVSAGHVETAGGALTAGTYHLNLGFALDDLLGGVLNQGIETSNTDAADPTQTESMAENTDSFMYGTKGAGIIALGKVDAILNDGFTFIMDNADTAQNWIGFLAGNFAGASVDTWLL